MHCRKPICKQPTGSPSARDAPATDHTNISFFPHLTTSSRRRQQTQMLTHVFRSKSYAPPHNAASAPISSPSGTHLLPMHMAQKTSVTSVTPHLRSSSRCQQQNAHAYSPHYVQTLHLFSRFCSHTNAQNTSRLFRPWHRRYKPHHSHQLLRASSFSHTANVKLTPILTSFPTHAAPFPPHLQQNQYAVHPRGAVLASWTVGWDPHPTPRDAGVNPSAHLDPSIIYRVFYNMHLP